MFVVPADSTYKPTTSNASGGWNGLARRQKEGKANDNPKIAITRNVPADEKGQFVDVLS